MKRQATAIESNVLIYLNELREDGITNMFGATPYVVEMFGLCNAEARRLLTLWMNNFNEAGNYESVKLED